MDWSKVNWENFSNGLVFLVAMLISAVGLRSGKKKPAEPATETMELAGAVIDGRQAKELIEAFDRHSQALGKVLVELRAHGRALDRNTAATQAVDEAAETLQNSIGVLTLELARGGR